jgi:hypothetical protein
MECLLISWPQVFIHQIDPVCLHLSRQKNSGAEGERLKEAANINKSLSTLGY